MLNELHELMEVRIEVEKESTLLGCTELVGELMAIQLSARLREDTEEASWQALPMSCVWVVN